jgi:hypothetical protein
MSVEPLARWGTIRWNSLQQDDSFWLERCAIFSRCHTVSNRSHRLKEEKTGYQANLSWLWRGRV